MIEFLDSNICCLKWTPITRGEVDDFSNILSQEEPVDAIVILDCIKPKEIFGQLQSYWTAQKALGKLLVIVAEHASIPNFPESWAVVPTKTEAIDYILFEQMQRDLGI